MMTIWKYNLGIQDYLEIDMPIGADILDMQMQHGIPTLWALVDPEAKEIKRKFIIRGTGHDIDGELYENMYFIGTFQMDDGNLIFHVFEVL